MSGKRATIDKHSKKREELRMRLEEESGVLKEGFAKLESYLDSSAVNVTANRLLAQSFVDISKKLNDTALGACLFVVGKLQNDIGDLQLKLCEIMTEKLRIPMRDHRNLIKDTIKKKDTSGSEVQRSKANIAERLCEYVEEFRDYFRKGAELLRTSAEGIAPLKQRAKSESESALLATSGELSPPEELTPSPSPSPSASPTPSLERRPKGVVFGQPLSTLEASEGIPVILDKAYQYLDGPILETIGLFRITGATPKVNALKEEVDSGKPIDFASVSQPHIVCTVLKQWLRMLPEPLIIFSLFDQFLNVAKEVIAQKQINQLKSLIEALPSDHVIVLDFVCALCRKIASRADVNKMTLKNLASLIAPNILYSKGPSTTLLEDMSFANQVISILFENYDDIFASVQYTKKPAPVTVTEPVFAADGVDASPSPTSSKPSSESSASSPIPTEDTTTTSAASSASPASSPPADEASLTPDATEPMLSPTSRSSRSKNSENGSGDQPKDKEHRRRDKDKERRHRDKKHKKSSSDPDALRGLTLPPQHGGNSDAASPEPSPGGSPPLLSPAHSRESSLSETPVPASSSLDVPSSGMKPSASAEAINSSSPKSPNTRLFPKSVSPLLASGAEASSGPSSTDNSPLRGFRKQSERRSSVSASEGVGGVELLKPASAVDSERIARRRSSSVAEGSFRVREVKRSGKSRTSSLSSLRFENSEEFELMMDDIFGTASAKSGWVLLGYSKSNTLKLQTCGDGGVNEVVSKLSDDEVQYILIRMNLPGSGSATRDVFIQWIGCNVSAIQKGIKKAHVGEVKLLLQPFHAELHATSRDNFTEAVVLDRSSPLSGSHVID